MKTEELNIFRELFAMEYLYISLNQVTDTHLSEFLSRPYVSRLSLDMQLSLCSDWCQAQQKCDIQE